MTTTTRTTTQTTLAAMAAAGLAATIGLASIGTAAVSANDPSAKAPAQTRLKFTGLSAGGELLSFNLKQPGKVTKTDVSGLLLDADLVGIDYRPADGKLYGVGDLGGIYTVNAKTGAASKVGQLSTLLDGEQFGVDFNPVVDRLRIVSDAGQNLRHDVDGNATTTDTPLSTPPAAGDTTGISAAAYLNNDESAETGTLLYDLNTATDQLVVQAPANNGTLSVVGKLGLNAKSAAGFDVFTTVKNGAAVANTAYAALHVKAQYRLYQVDLTTGRVTKVKGFAKGTDIVDLAIVPAP